MSTRALITYDTTPWAHPSGAVDAGRLSDAQSPPARRQHGTHDFFAGKSLSELAREQGVGPIEDIRSLAGGLPDDEDIDEMLGEIYRSRQP